MDQTQYKCPNCGDVIKFAPASGEFKCDACDSVFPKATIEAMFGQDGTGNAQTAPMGQDAQPPAAGQGTGYSWQGEELEIMDGVVSYACKSCGAEVVADVNTAATKCPYCDNPIVLNANVRGVYQPQQILPFKLDKKAAINALVKHYKSCKYVPPVFNPEKRLVEVKGIYVPFWLFDSGVYADVSYEGTKVRTWSDRNYNYTETSYYNIRRQGNLYFRNIPTDASAKMEDEYMDALEPFHFQELQPFNSAYMSGFLADKFDVEVNEAFPRAQERIKNTTQDEFRKTVQGYSSVRPISSAINPANSSYRYVMLPVWILTTKYENKIYKFAVNGQTGEVAGELPLDKKKVMLHRILYTAIPAVVMSAAYWLWQAFS